MIRTSNSPASNSQIKPGLSSGRISIQGNQAQGGSTLMSNYNASSSASSSANATSNGSSNNPYPNDNPYPSNSSSARISYHQSTSAGSHASSRATSSASSSISVSHSSSSKSPFADLRAPENMRPRESDIPSTSTTSATQTKSNSLASRIFSLFFSYEKSPTV